MAFAEDQEEILARLWSGIRRERLRGRRPIPAGDEDVEKREPAAEHQERRAEPHRRVRVREAGVDRRLPYLEQCEEHVLGWERPRMEPGDARDGAAGETEHEAVLNQEAHAILASGRPRRGRARCSRGHVRRTSGPPARLLPPSAPRATTRTPDPSRSWCRSVD